MTALEKIVRLVFAGAAFLAACSAHEDQARSTRDAGADAAAGSGGSGGSNAGGAAGVSGASGGASGAGAGAGGSDGTSGASPCVSPPPIGFDPLAGYVPPALVATVVVSATTDDGAGSLRAAITGAAPDAVVGFAPELAGQTIRLDSAIELARSVTIDGSSAPGLTIDAQQKGRAFSFNGDQAARLAFFGLRIVNGRTDGSGGAIDINGGHLDIEIGGSRFENNSAGEGGAVRVGYAKDTDAYIHDSVFIENDGSVTQSGFSGGAISAIGTNLHIARCRFERNVGSASGAVYTIHSDPVLEDSVFVENRSSGDSGTGAFFTDGGGPGDDNNPGTTPGKNVILRTRFASNRGAGSDGGAIMLWGYLLDTLTIEDSVFQQNRCEGSAKGGGAKIHARNKLRIARTAFVENVSTDQGGGIWLDGEGPFEIENVLFAGNRAENDRGGGATLNVAGKVALTNVTFASNAAGQGCGAFWLPSADADVHLKNSIVAFNTGKNSWEIQVGYPPIDAGGNVEWPNPQAGSRVAQNGKLEDPALGPLTEVAGSYVLLPLDGSPVIDNAIMPAPATDLRGAPRDAKPDTGAYEYGASCE